MKTSLEASEEENNEGASDDDVEITILTRNFNRFLKRKHPSRTRDFNKKYDGEGKKKTKELLAMNARNRVTSKVSAPSSSSRTKEQRTRRKYSKLLRMTPPNPKWKRNKVK